MPLRANQNQFRRAAVARRSTDRPRYDLMLLEERRLLSTTPAVATPDALTNLVAPSISGEVFYDNDHASNAIAGRTTNGHGIANVEVDLYEQVAGTNGAAPTLTLQSRAITDLQGNYGFGGLTANDTYTIEVIVPPQYLIGPVGNSVDDTVNSHTTGSNEVVDKIASYTPPVLMADSAIVNANCGLFSDGTVPVITGTVFNDLNDDGVADDGITVSPAGVITVGQQPVLSGVTVDLLNPANNSVLLSTVTDAAGVYTFPNVVVGTDYLVRFDLKTGYQFSPQFVGFTPTAFSWADPTTGIVGSPTQGQFMFNGNGFTTVYPSQTFHIYSDTAQTDVDCGMWTEVIKITPASPTIARPHNTASIETFTVTITPSNDLTVDVPYTTVNGTAIAGTDYTAESGTLHFTPGVSVLTIGVPILPSNTPELDVTFSTHITANATDFPDTIDNITSASCTIINTNFPSLSISNVEAARPTSGTIDFNFIVTLSSTAPFPVDVSYQTVDSSAVAGTNYTAESGTLVIPAHSLTGTVSVPVLAGTGPTQSKSFLVVVQDITNLAYETTAASAIAEGVGTIDSNTPPQLSVTGGQVTESLIGNFLLPFTVTVAPAPTTTVTINYATSDGTGVAGVDYAATSGSLTFAPGQSSQIVNVLAYRRFLAAQDKTVNLTVTDPTSTYNITTATAAGVIHDIATVALPLTARQRVTYTDYLSNPVTVSMKGPGSGTLVFLGDTSVSTNAYEIILTGTTAASSLAVTTRHNLQTSFINILDDSSIGVISARSTNVLGLVTIAGSLNTLNLDFVQGATITVGPGTGTLGLSFVRAIDTSISSAIPIRSLTANSYVDSNGVPDTISAPSVGPIRVKQGFGGTVVQAATVSSIIVGGSMAGTEVLASESIGNITAGSITGSTIFAGVDPASAAGSSSAGLPGAADFTNAKATIGVVHVKAGGFGDSRIASWNIGTLSLGKIDSTDDGVTFGVVANKIGSVLGSSGTPIRLLGVNAASTPLVDDDFTVKTV